MARKPQKAPETSGFSDKPLREWRVSIMRDKKRYLGRVVATDKEAAIDKAMEEFRIEPARPASADRRAGRVSRGRQ